MVLLLEQRAFIMKWYNETHSLKHICDDFIQIFLNSVSASNYAKPNLIKKFENTHTLDDLPHPGQPSVVIFEKRETIAKNVTEHPTTSSQLGQ